MLTTAAEHVEADGAEGEEDDELQHDALPQVSAFSNGEAAYRRPLGACQSARH